MYDAFPLVRTGAGPRLLYCLAIQYARHGDLSAFLKRTAKSWPERSRPAGDRRHPPGARPAASRPDAAPRPDAAERLRMRRTAAQARRLRHRAPQNNRRGVTARTLNASMVPSDMLATTRRSGARATTCIRWGSCSRCSSKATREPASAARSAPAPAAATAQGNRLPLHRRAAEALRERGRADRGARRAAGVLNAGVLRTLKGVHLAFTGILTGDATTRCAPPGAPAPIVHGIPPRGRPSSCAAGRIRCRPPAGRRPEADGDQTPRKKGHKITLLNESQFWKLAGQALGEKPCLISMPQCSLASCLLLRFREALKEAPVVNPARTSASRRLVVLASALIVAFGSAYALTAQAPAKKVLTVDDYTKWRNITGLGDFRRRHLGGVRRRALEHGAGRVEARAASS